MKSFLYVLEAFHKFETDKFHEVLIDMNRRGKGRHEEHRRHQGLNL